MRAVIFLTACDVCVSACVLYVRKRFCVFGIGGIVLILMVIMFSVRGQFFEPLAVGVLFELLV